MKVSSWSAVASAVLLSCLAPVAQTASLLAIDYGTDGFKVALIKPGVPFDVLINKDSKRKTPSMVTLRGDERSFGGEAANLVRGDHQPSRRNGADE
jgi:hypoxia up-regulated 1